jgi:quercetin dioxygenase-like cupin family protein
MQTIRFADLQLDAVEQDADDAEWLAGFPFSPDRPGETRMEASDYTVVFNELAPGKRIGSHTDAADELLFVLDGQVTATVDGETATVEAGSLAVIPAETPHSVHNDGSAVARMVGVFGMAPLSSTFESEPRVTGPE